MKSKILAYLLPYTPEGQLDWQILRGLMVAYTIMLLTIFGMVWLIFYPELPYRIYGQGSFRDPCPYVMETVADCAKKWPMRIQSALVSK